jgi:polyisoprenoid-binding protein YceI
MRKKLAAVTLTIALCGSATAAQSTYTIDTTHSSVGFRVRHLVTKVSGQFNEFDGTIVADFQNLDASSVEFVIKTASIDTGNEERDGHLRSPDFFDAETYPEITFTSTKITKKDDATYVVTGNLTIRGVTRNVVLDVDYLGEVQALGGTRAGYEISTTIDRREFGVSWNRVLDQGGVVLGDDVEVMIDLEVVRQPTE